MDWAGEREGSSTSLTASRPKYPSLLLRTGYLMTGDAKDAEDLAQETLLRVARRWKRVRVDGPPGRLRPPHPDQPRAA